jgi:hydroxymethylbilane synthase
LNATIPKIVDQPDRFAPNALFFGVVVCLCGGGFSLWCPLEKMAMREVVLGTRKSKLALVQTEAVRGMLERAHPELKFSLREISTVGDKILDKPLSQIGDKGLFTKELEEALYRKDIDLAVHSLKDVQTTLPKGLALGAISEREDQRDAVVLRASHKAQGAKSLDDLPEGAVIGTSSLRRVAQLKRRYPKLRFETIRGNLQTRLSKLEAGDFDAIILAFAGLNRLGLSENISSILDPEICFPAVGQGALAVECREGDESILKLLREAIHHSDTALCCHAERAFMRHLEGGCLTPIAVWCRLLPPPSDSDSDSDRRLVLQGRVLSLDGQQCIAAQEELRIPASVAPEAEESLGKELGVRLAETLRGLGADDILRSIARENPHLNAPPQSTQAQS